MHTNQEDNFGSEDKIPLVDRRNFLRGVAATAAVATVGGPAALVTPALAAEGGEKDKDRRKDKDRVPPDQISIQLFTLRDQLAIGFEGTIAALHAIGYTRVEHAGFVGAERSGFQGGAGRQWHRLNVRPRPHPAAVRPGHLECLARRRERAGVDLHRASVLRDQLREPVR